MMKPFVGKIVGDGPERFVTGYWDSEVSPNGISGWYGTIQDSGRLPINPGDFQIELEDLEGDTEVVAIRVRSTSGPTSDFRGSGPSPSF